MQEQIVETWQIHARITLYLLDAVAPEALGGVATSKGRSVAAQFAHIHNVRLMWLAAAAPDLVGGLVKIEKEPPPDKLTLHTSLMASGAGIEQLLHRALDSGGRIKGFKPHAVAFLGYLIAHESYHHGEIGVALTQSGHPLDRKTAYGMWEWGTR
jgi:uncharacterized damage-inducible protein DinB